jgi:hypothetical protein
MPALNIKPQFQAERITGNFKRTVMHIEEDVRMIGPLKDKSIITRTMKPVIEEFHEAYMIYFPQGHSMMVAADDVDQLMRIGVLDDPKMVDMETGEVVPDDYNLTPKEIVQRKERNRPRPMQEGLTALDEGEIN